MRPDLIVDPRSTAFSDPSYRGVLPHLSKPGGTYFVTFCLADVARGRALERGQLREEINSEMAARQSDLDPSSGECILKDPGLAAIVEDALLHFQGERYALSAWCVMPNHVHAVVTPFVEHALSEILQAWKSYSAHVINRRMKRTGKVWQKESFDHLVRSSESFERFVIYTEQNPVAAGLVARAEDWRFSSARHRGGL
jgi:REP element-mobilizing transposase RayT